MTVSIIFKTPTVKSTNDMLSSKNPDDHSISLNGKPKTQIQMIVFSHLFNLQH